MPRPSHDDWDTPGGPGGTEALAEVKGPSPGPARALLASWRQAVDEIAVVRIMKATVKPAVFNTFRRVRLDEGITDAQLAISFEIFATAVRYGDVNVRHGDLWRAYASQWARWVSAVPTATQRPLRDRQGPRPQR